MIAARRPNAASPRGNGRPAASGPPQAAPGAEEHAAEPEVRAQPVRRAARIVKPSASDADDAERLRLRLLDRVRLGEGRGAISRAVNEYLERGFVFPEDQEVQLQLLEHFDETRAREAIATLERLLEAEEPIKKPVLEQRLRRLEEYADEPGTREAAASLRRAIR